MNRSTPIRWYVWCPRNNLTIGPLTEKEVIYRITVGRISPFDNVSQDGKLWERVSGVPELLCDEFLKMQGLPEWKPAREDV